MRLLFRILVPLLVIAVITTVLLYQRWQAFVTTPVLLDVPVPYYLERGSSFGRVARELHQAGVISDARLFTYFARFENAQGSIKAGIYQFEGEITPKQILTKLVNGDFLRMTVTIPEGFTCAEIATRLEERLLGSAEEFTDICRSPEQFGFGDYEGRSLEGYLFPDTYVFTLQTPPREIIATMLREFEERYSRLQLPDPLPNGLSRSQLVTLASIVQKESGRMDEMPRISAVFHNRLKVGMPLQADPTVIYGIDGFDGNLTRQHLRTYSPYNTYVIKGLPAGPICNPGEEALLATAYPAEDDAVYFVAKGDGYHVFARTLREHNANVRTYQLKR